jgi:ankyrin repeat protein
LCASKPDVLSWQDPSDGGSTVLHEAARLNMRETVRVLLRTPGINVNAQDYSGATALRVAVNHCSTPIVRSLAEHPGVDVLLASLDGSTPLSSCRGQSALKFTEIRRALHRAGAAEGTDEAPMLVHSAPDHVRAEVFAAVAQRDIATLNTLARAWEHAPEVFNDGDARDRGITPLMVAAGDKESTAALSLLLSLPGIEVNKADHSGETALHVCCRCGNLEGFHRLVASAEADPNKQDIRRGRTPLMAAIKEGNRELVKALLLLQELDLSLQDYRGETALSVANKSPELRPLLQREMDQQAAGPTEGIDAALLAALASLNIASGSSNGVGLLASPPSATNGINGINGTNGGAATDVSTALRSGNLTAVGECLLAAAKIGDAAVFAKVEAELGAVEEVWNYADASYSQFTPLHYAVMNDHIRLVRALCMNPCVDVNRADAENSTPAHVAVLHDRRECLRVLLTHEQIDLRRRDRNTDTPLSMCARHDRRNCARHLAVHHSARRFINSTNPGGLTALNIAAFNGFVEIVKHLIGAPDIDVNKPNKKNSTPLIEAVRKGKTDIVRLLLKHPKIDLTHRCSYGGDALASSLRFPEVRQVLIDAYRERGLAIPADI